MRFEPRKKRIANPVGRRESRTLLMLVMLLGFVLVMVGKAMNPETWSWFFDRGQPQPEQVTENEGDELPDTRIAVPIPLARLEDQITLPLVKQPDATAVDMPGYFPGVKPELLSQVEDNREFNSDELAPRMNLLEVLKRSDQQQLTKASMGEVGFRQLLNQPHVYRGKLVTIVGSVRQAEYENSPVADGVERYFVMWLKLDGPQRPVAVYCLEKPNDFPEGKKLDEKIRVTGFFFKKRAYEAQDTFRVAPALFAKTFRWQPVVTEPRWQATNEQLAWIFGGAAAFALLVVALASYRSRQLFVSRREQDTTIAVSEDQVLPSVGEQLSELIDQQAK